MRSDRMLDRRGLTLARLQDQPASAVRDGLPAG
ncbi:MAG: hypothetical protein QOJ29_2886 [Thermoleophilaceae bacterium]|jgi:hypothetical protein|nr:hypothetical protein [Thermoleophilaceae bacterium]